MKSFFIKRYQLILLVWQAWARGPSSCSGGGSGCAQWQLQLQLQAAQR